jgi:hypothetical protein
MLDRRDQPARIKCEFVDEVSAPKLQSQTIFENFAQALPRGLGSPTRAVRKPTRSTGIRSANPASKRKRLRCAPTKGLPTGFERAFYARPFRAIARGFAAMREMGMLNAGVRNSEAFIWTRKARSRGTVYNIT